MNKIKLFNQYIVHVAIYSLCILQSCKIYYPNQMFKSGDYQFFDFAQKASEQYVIKPGDQLTLSIFSRNGFRLIDVLSNSDAFVDGNLNSESRSNPDFQSSIQSGNNTNRNSQFNRQTNYYTYPVDVEGFVKLPILGNIHVEGFTESELEKILAEKYVLLFVDPFIILRVANRRALVFKGNEAMIVPLNDAPTSLIEVIARSGGIDQNLKAYKIKLIRGDLQNPQIMLFDLSTIDGVGSANITVQSNDIIYIEQLRKPVLDTLKEITPILSLLTTSVGVFYLISTLTK